MRRRSLIAFVILNVLISLGVAYGVISVMNGQSRQQSSQIVITVPILVTATRDPNAAPQIKIITATPLPGTPASIGALPTGLLDVTVQNGSPVPTLNATDLSINPGLQGTATALPQNCIIHVIQSGDSPFAVAEQYGVSGFDVMKVNGLNDETAALLQIGDSLIIPLPGCPLLTQDVPTATSPSAAVADAGNPESTAEETGAETTAEPTARATLTLPPTATNAQVEIVEVVGAGDVTKEGVVIRNNGKTVDFNGWTLSDSNNNVYTFAQRLMFSGGSVTVFTRTGQETPVALFWNKSDALFGSPGAVLTLKDAKGQVQSTYRVPAAVNLP
jgi:LysM repeat protein